MCSCKTGNVVLDCGRKFAIAYLRIFATRCNLHTQSLRVPYHPALAVQQYHVAMQWHMNRPLLARRSGVFQSAICRNESLDVLGHLSSDGCMRPW